MPWSVIIPVLLALGFGLLLGIAALYLRVKGSPVADKINELLPQTQCAQCGYPGCRPYAEAMARGEADINLCVPGGDSTMHNLADLLDREPLELATEKAKQQLPMVALIDEKRCIGCTLCIQACPVDAILGASKQMHTVIAVECTGCELCLPVCPVDCILLKPRQEPLAAWNWPLPEALARFSGQATD